MANIKLTWDVPTDVSDIDTFEVYVCDTVNHKTTDAEFQTSLDAIHAGTSTIGGENLVLVQDNIATNVAKIDSWTTSMTGMHHFVIAAKNQGGYKVGDGSSADSAVATRNVT
jgi:hypothetical protein